MHQNIWTKYPRTVVYLNKLVNMIILLNEFYFFVEDETETTWFYIKLKNHYSLSNTNYFFFLKFNRLQFSPLLSIQKNKGLDK